MNEYYIIPDIEELEQTTDPERQNILRRRIAANVGDRESLMQLLGVSSLDPDSFYPDQLPPALSTVDTIDAFLGKFGTNLPDHTPGEDEPLIPVAPAVDYLTLLDIESGNGSEKESEEPEKDAETVVKEPEPAKENAEEAVPVSKKDIRPAIRVNRPEQPEETPDLTESFAKVLIKNGNYSRAYEILEQLHLKNPEKSIYFADQMRFLRKLIALSKNKR